MTYGERAPRQVRDPLLTIGAAILAMHAAALLGLVVRDHTLRAVVTLAAYIALLALVAFRCGPARRTSGAVLIGTALVYPLAFVLFLLLLSMMPGIAPDVLEAIIFPLGLVFASLFSIGFQFDGGPDTPGFVYITLWYANVPPATMAVVLARGLVWEAQARRAD